MAEESESYDSLLEALTHVEVHGTLLVAIPNNEKRRARTAELELEVEVEVRRVHLTV